MDFTQAIEIADNIYWIGSYLKNDPFQCHAYLIKNGDESVLIDPGSMLEFEHLIAKAQTVVDLNDIKYIVIHHQDPDLAASVPEIEKLIERDDLQIVTHSRITVLVKHYLIQSPFYEVDKNEFKLETKNGLRLDFITTPYCHSPGAFVSYEPTTKSLFSSDIFGGLEESWHFYAQEDYFQYAKEFHASYMPGKDIFNYSLRKIEQLDLNLIMPQHGSIIKKQYIAPLIADMKNLECGLYIDNKYNDELLDAIQKLKESQKALHQQQKFLQDVVNGASDPMMVINTDYSIALMNDAAKHSMNMEYVADSHHPKCYEVSHHRSTPCEGKDDPCPLKMVVEKKEEVQVTHNHPLLNGQSKYVELSAKPLMDEHGEVYAIIELSHDITSHLKTREHLTQQKKLSDYKANHDELTKLPGRRFLLEQMQKIIRKCIEHNHKTAIIFIDLDNFKPINDTYGHQAGDSVLKAIAHRLKNLLRKTDIVARIGGDEFVVVLNLIKSPDNVVDVLDKLIKEIKKPITFESQKLSVTASVGVSICPDNGMDIDGLLEKADRAMYHAKHSGRNIYSFFKE
ncbi:MAG: diguanylate cyclase [Gammaproteobacteria bacterium]|nr:diguanylate cyclase [Gammaproteobacteria bacterium]